MTTELPEVSSDETRYSSVVAEQSRVERLDLSVAADGVNRNIFILLRSMLAVYYVRLQWKSHGENTVNGHCSVI